MNSSTRLRLAKEARALLPFWAAIAALMVVPFLLRSDGPPQFAFFTYGFGCALLGSVVIGQEFQHRTIGLLLSQPVSRRRLWWEKMAVLAAALLGLAMVLALLAPFDTHTDWTKLKSESFDHILAVIAICLLPPLVGFCTGPVLTLLARGTIGGVALTFLCPWALTLPIWFFMPDDEAFKSGQFTLEEITAVFLCLYVAPSAYIGGLALLGCRRFQYLEDNQSQVVELSLPASLLRAFASLSNRLTLNHRGVLGQLVRKEVRLHLPAFVVAGMLVGLWLLLLAVVIARTSVSKDFLMLPAVLLGLGIPVIAGIVSTAEERSLGLLDWHLTLPVSARRQWFIKVLVALAVNVVLGILLPGVLGQVASVLLEGKPMQIGLRNGEQHFLIANAVIFCAALYASTAASNSMRALVGTIVLFLAGAMVLNFADYIPRWFPVTWTTYSPDWNERPGGIASLFFWIDQYRWLLGWSCLAVWLYFLGLTGFRRSLESFWQPVRRMAVFFAVVCAFVFAAIVLRYDYASLLK